MWALDETDVPEALRMLERAGADLDAKSVTAGRADVRPAELPAGTLALMDQQDRQTYEQERAILSSDEYDVSTLGQ